MRKMSAVQNSSSYSVGASATSSSRTTTTTTGGTQSRRESRDSWNRFFPVTSRDMFFDDSLFENTRSRFNHKIRSILDDWDEREMEADDTWRRRSVALEKRLNRKRQIQSFSERQDNQTFSVISEDSEYKIILSVGNLRLEDINVRVVGRKEVAVEGRRDGGIKANLPDQNTLKNFHYQFSLPENTNMDAITSVLSTDGFLIISIPKMVNCSESHISGVSSTSRVTVNKSAINSASSINCGNESATSMKCQDVSHVCNSCGQNSKFQNSTNAEKREEFEDDFHSNNSRETKIQDKTEENSVEGESSHTFAPDGSSYSSSSSFDVKTLPIRRGKTSSTDYCLKTNDGDLLTTLKGFLSKRKTQSVKEADLDSQKELQSYHEKQQTKVQKLYEDHLLCMFAVDVQDFLPDGDISIKSIGKRELEVKCHRSKLETSSKPTNSITERFVLPEDAQPDSAEASVLSSDGLLIIIVRKKDELRKVKEVIVPISFEETGDETQCGQETKEIIVGSDDQSCQQHPPSVTNKKTCVNDDRSDGLHHLSSNASTCFSSLTVDESVTRQNGTLNQVLMESGSTKPTQNEEYLKEEILQTEDVVHNTSDDQLKEIVNITDKRESIQQNDSECNKKENYSQLQDSKRTYERTDDCCGEKETKSRLELVSRGSKVSSEGFDSCEISHDSTNKEEKEEIRSSLHRDQESISLSVEEKGLFFEDFYFENMRESLLSAIRGVLSKYSDPSAAEDELTCYRNLKTQGLLLLKESEILSLSLEDESNYKFVLDVNDVIEQGGVKVTILNGRKIRVESEIPVNEFDSESCQHFSKGFSLSGDISIESASSAISSDGFLVIIVPKKILSVNSLDSREEDETPQQMLGQLDDSDLNKKKQTLRTKESWKPRNLDVDDDRERRDSRDHYSTTTSHKQMNNQSLDDGYSKTLGDSTTFSTALDSSDQNISQKVLAEHPATGELDISQKDSSETVKSQDDYNIKIENIDASEFLSREKKETKINTVTPDHRISIKKAKIAETAEEEEEEHHSVEHQGLRTFHNTEEMDDNTLREEDTGKEEHKEFIISLSDELETSSNKSCSLGISQVNKVLPLIRSEVDEKTAAVSQSDKSITLLVQERGLLAEDGFFESVRKESLEAMNEILTQCGDLPSTGNELTNYRILRSQDVKEEHRLAKSYEDEHQFKIIMDVNAFKLQKNLYVKVTKEMEIIVGFPLEEKEGKNYNKSFFVTGGIDVESAMCGLSSDGFIAITFAKKDVTVSAEDSSSTSSTGMIQGSKATAEKISECSINTLSSTDVRFATRSGSVIGQNCNASLTDEQRPSSTMNHPTNDQTGFSEVELPIESKTSYDNDSLIQDVSSNTSNSSSTGIKFTASNKQVMADPLARQEWDVSKKSSSEQVKSQDHYKKNIDNCNANEFQSLEKEFKINTGTSNPHESFSNPKDEFDEEEYHHLKQQGVRISHTEDMDDNTQWGNMGNEERKDLISLSDELETSSNNSCGRGISKDNEDLALIRSEMDEKTAAVSQFDTCFTLLVQEKGLFDEDCFFEGVRKHSLEAVKEILTQCGDLPSTGDDLTNYRILRSQDVKEEHRLAKSYEDEQQFKIIMDVSEFMKQNKLYVKVTKENEIIVGFHLEENEDEFEISNSFNKSFIVMDDIDVASAMCGLSSDGFIAITFTKKNVSFSGKDFSIMSVNGVSQDSKLNSEQISECGMKAQYNADTIVTANTGSVLDQKSTISSTDVQRAFSPMDTSPIEQRGSLQVELAIDSTTSRVNNFRMQDHSSNAVESSYTDIAATTKQVLTESSAKEEWDLSEKISSVQVKSQDDNNDKIDNDDPSEYQSWQKETEIDPVTSDRHPNNSFGNPQDAEESHPANHSQEEEQKAVRTSHTEDRDDVTRKQDKGKGEISSSEQSETSSKYSCVFGISKDNEDLSLMRSEVDEKTASVSLFDNCITLLIQEKGLLTEDGFFESVRKESLEAMKEILTQCGDLPSTGDELTNYRILRSQDVKEEHRLAKSYEDEHQYKIIMDVSEFMEQKKIYTKVTKDKEIIVGFPLEENEGEFEFSKNFYKSFMLSDGIDVESAMCGLSSDGFLAITFTKKDLSFSTEELSVTSVGGMIQGSMVTSEEISDCGIKTQINTDAIITSNIGSVEDHNFNGSLTVEQKASSQIGNSSYDLQHSNTASGISFRNPGNTDDVTILPVTKRGLFFRDTFFQDVHLQFQTAMKEALEKSSEEETCTDTSVIQSYKCLRKQNPKIENQAFHVQDDQHFFKVVLDVEDLAEESIAVYLVDEKNLVIEGQTDRLEDTSSESSSHTFTRQFSLPAGVDLDSITASLSLDRVLLIESEKKRRNVTHGEDLRSAIELYLFLQRHSNSSSYIEEELNGQK